MLCRRQVLLHQRRMQMSKSLKLCCVLAVIASLLLSGVLLMRSIGKKTSLTAIEGELSVSRKHWETVAAEKESLQDTLSDITSQLREAQLTIDESETRASELNAEVAQLETDISSLISQLDQLGISSDVPPS